LISSRCTAASPWNRWSAQTCGPAGRRGVARGHHHDGMDPPQQQGKPLYADYGRLLAICAKHDVCISLGDAFRPGALADATDRVQVQELVILGELVKRARENNVGVFVEGPGTCPLNQVVSNIQNRENAVRRRAFLRAGSARHRRFARLRPYLGGHRRRARRHGGRGLFMLRDAGGAPPLPSMTTCVKAWLPRGSRATRQTSPAAFPAPWNGTEKFPAQKLTSTGKNSFRCALTRTRRPLRASLPPQGDQSHCSICGEFCAIRRSKSVQPG